MGAQSAVFRVRHDYIMAIYYANKAKRVHLRLILSTKPKISSLFEQNFLDLNRTEQKRIAFVFSR